MEKDRKTIEDIGGTCRFCSTAYEGTTQDERGNFYFNTCPACRKERYGEPKPSLKQRIVAYLTKPLSA